MLDLKFIRDNLDLVRENTRRRNSNADPDRVAALYEQRNRQLAASEALRQKRNANAQAMKGRLPPEQRQVLIEEGKKLKEEIAALESSLAGTEAELAREAGRVPNLTHPGAPPGTGEQANRELKRWGEPPRFEFKPKDHLELGQALDLVDFETAAAVSGQKFYYLKNEAALLELALVRYVFDLLQAEGYTLTITPDIAKEEVVEGIGFSPRGEESNIYTVEGTGTCLIGTAEITLGGYYAGRILDRERLPLRIAGLSHCFRREAGAAGQFSKGLYRVHQFTKVEMFVFCLPERSEAEHQGLLELEERIFQGLEIPYRVVDTCVGDLGGPAYRKFDLEAWMPGRGEAGEWGEITSTSNCTDYQARRLGIRTREEGKNVFVHMLNGTAVAVSRALIAILENFQRADGSVRLPERLVPYAGFRSIGPKAGSRA